MECKYEVDGFCTNGDCPLCADSCPVWDVEGVCKYEVREDVGYQLTPKGCAVAAFAYAELPMERLDGFWDEFVRLMKRDGYVWEGE